MRLAYFESHPRIRWLAFVPLAAGPILCYWLVSVTGAPGWLILSLLPLMLVVGFWGTAEGISMFFVLATVFTIAGLREPELPARIAVGYQFLILILSWAVALFFQYRQRQEESAYRDYLSSLDERLIMAREQYKADLVINISNQKKIQKYFLLNRISRVFGSQLELAKLADIVMQEVQEVIGADRGRFMLAYMPPGHAQPLIRTHPENIQAESILDDQFGLWTAQHRTALLVSDAQKDFRFHADPSKDSPQSLMVAPLLIEGRVTGILRAESSQPRVFTTDDLRIFTILADLASVAAENARLYQRTQELSITDGLTGMYLRRFFNQRLDEEITRFHEFGTPFSLLILDLDHFKRVNDRLGHLAGDQVLMQIADVLRAEARGTDILCRFGGEEFALLLPSTPALSGKVMADRICAHVAQQPFRIFQEYLKLTVSIGIAGCPEQGQSQAELVKNTDTALYIAKREGRNRVVVAGGETC